MAGVSVVIPVKDGERYLRELLDAVLAQGPDEVLMIDSGSRDASVEIAREAGATVLEIPPESFGHGRTRNLGAERTRGDVIAFLTQDATPLPGWLDAVRDGFAEDERIGAVYGPHLARPDTSPMIARELEEFFATHPPLEPWLSNVNAAYRRACWAQVRFDDVPYAEDQAFARAMTEAGWALRYLPEMRVLHAHDYPPMQFMRRYFDEYRGLRETIGHVERIGLRSTVRHVRGSVAGDRAWMRSRGLDARAQARWTARSAFHHGGRKAFSALGSRAEALPEGLQRRLSLEGRGAAAPPAPPITTTPIPAAGPSHYEAVLKVARDGPAPLLEPAPGAADADALHIAVAIPPFRRGSGGHNSIFQILSRLEAKGHAVSVWVHDPEGWQAAEWPAVIRQNINDYFAPFHGPVFKGFDQWYGADVAVATGWQTVHPVLTLEGNRSRAYLVHDHESEFYATSAQSLWAEQTYRFGMHPICSSPWLGELVGRLHDRFDLFDFGVDHAIYHPRDVPRRRDTIVFYGRDVTPRRAVPLGILALEELKRRRPGLRVVFFGDEQPARAPFEHEHLGVASPDQLAQVFSEATVGLVLSMTNYSLIPQEMLACGLPCVDLAGFSAETVFGADGPVELSEPDPVLLADAVERLLDDEDLWHRRSEAGREFVADRTWDRAAEQVDWGLRQALRYAGHAQWEERAEEAEALAHPARLGHGADVRTVPVASEPRERRATSRLLARLPEADRAALRRAVAPDEAAVLSTAGPAEQRVTLALATHHGIGLEHTGLVPDVPPAGVHAMARGRYDTGGAFYEADLIAEWVDVAAAGRVLDFGCSTGRVLRALAAAFPEAAFHGCDPNEAAIVWAQEHLPRGEFLVSPADPPLPYDDDAFGLVYAISIWSHYGEGAAERWLQEMHRVVRPGGHLVLTTHGLTSIALDRAQDARPARELDQIRRALYRRGHWFAPEFAAGEGDHGVVHPEWGQAFLTAEWLLRVVAGRWDVEAFGAGAYLGDQDLYVLRRR